MHADNPDYSQPLKSERIFLRDFTYSLLSEKSKESTTLILQQQSSRLSIALATQNGYLSHLRRGNTKSKAMRSWEEANKLWRSLPDSLCGRAHSHMRGQERHRRQREGEDFSGGGWNNTGSEK